jgi:hypothetical protein
MRWRIAKNVWNLAELPWRGVIGIEEDDDTVAVPSLVCWFMRGVDQADIEAVIRLHNENEGS